MADIPSPEQIAATRKQMEDMEHTSLSILGPCPPNLIQSTIDVRLQDGFISRTILIRPVSRNKPLASRQSGGKDINLEKLPLVVLMHGGSFSYCSPNAFISPARAFALHFNAIVASVAYKLAPECPFPAPAQSAWEVTAWLSEPKNINKIIKDEGLELDPNLGFVLGGFSAGANLAAVIAGINSASKAGYRDELVRGMPPIVSEITGLFISIPCLMEADIVPAEYSYLFRSRDEHANAPFVNARSLQEVRQVYNQDLHSPWFSPLNLDLAKIQGHHPGKVYVHYGELDILRDDAIIYERILKDGGLAETRIDAFVGYDHACWCNLMFDQAHTAEMKERTMDGMGWLLGLDWDRSTPLSH
ncbi:putative Alpha/beta hydrolase fold-domain-containing protein [Seiridium unicorne]|uniref:Alpha/beta hydrolase fold-domain-containing protein n=1 Tax=Seiridium unicorne TaxID=138068 RepID=A0ABR2VCS5_9PEZI